MTLFVGYSSIDQFKKFTLVDLELIKRDLLNAFNIRQGQLVGRPQYGTNLWDFMFESQMTDTEQAIQDEIQRVVGGDPRIFVTQPPQLFPQDNGLLIQLDVQFIPSSEALRLSIFFDVLERRASYL
jgi:phage baseplate assembly protein W